MNITEKVDRITWGKVSKKNGDFGWLKSIPSSYRKQFAVGSPLPLGIYTTIRAAVLYEIASTDSYLCSLKETDDTEPPDKDDLKYIAELEAELAALRRRLEKL